MELLKKNHQQRHGIVSVQNKAFVPGVNALLRVKYLRHVFSSVALNVNLPEPSPEWRCKTTSQWHNCEKLKSCPGTQVPLSS